MAARGGKAHFVISVFYALVGTQGPQQLEFDLVDARAAESKAADLGRHTVVEAMAGDTAINAIVEGAPPERGAEIKLAFDPRQTRLYADSWLATKEASSAREGPGTRKEDRVRRTARRKSSPLSNRFAGSGWRA